MSNVFDQGHAVLIGVGGNDIPQTVNDATALYNLLTDKTVAAYPTNQVELLTESAANKSNILNALDKLIDRIKNDSDATVVVYFSGHGERLTLNGQPPEHFLVPNGFTSGRYKQTSISSEEFITRIEAIQSRKLIVLLDCCHAGGVPQPIKPGIIEKSPMPPELLNVLKAGSGRVVLASSQETEESYIKKGASNSIFTECLLEALSGKAASKQDGTVRLFETLGYLYDEVPKRASPHSQHPFLNNITNLSENFVLSLHIAASKSFKSATTGTDQSGSGGAQILNWRLERQQRKRQDLKSAFDQLSERIEHLRKAWAIQSDVLQRFQSTKQILESEVERSEIEIKLEGLEKEIGETLESINKINKGE